MGSLEKLREIADIADSESKKAKEKADEEEKNAKATKELSDYIRQKVSELAKENKRVQRAVSSVNRDIEKIKKDGEFAINLAKEPHPILATKTPKVEKIIKNKRDVELAVMKAGSYFDSGTYRKTGVYFLLKENEIVYIGKSVHVDSRINTHAGDVTKDFDKACYIEVPEEKLGQIEECLIAIFKPEQNSYGVEKSEISSLSVFQDSIFKVEK